MMHHSAASIRRKQKKNKCDSTSKYRRQLFTSFVHCVWEFSMIISHLPYELLDHVFCYKFYLWIIHSFRTFCFQFIFLHSLGIFIVRSLTWFFFLFFVMCGYLFPLYFYMFYSSFVMLLCKTKRQIIFINRLLICILFPFLVMVKFVSGDFHQRFDDNFRNQPDDAEINYCGLINRWPPNERSILTFRGFNCFIQNSVFF